jgi:MYXO-CTERM domain-containing protein
MKKFRKLFVAISLVAASFSCINANAQQATPQTVDNRNTYNDGDGHVSPWWGLLGLIGLFGLMRRTDRTNLDEGQRPTTR